MANHLVNALRILEHGRCWVFILALLVSAPGYIFAATTVERGDTLLIEVFDEKLFSREARVDADGRIILPVLGGLEVAGRSLDEIRTLIEVELAARGLMRQPVVLVEFEKYRPVYVDGAVAKPGAITYLPGMTVRQAVIAAGGMKLRTEGEEFDSETLIHAVAQSQANAFQLLQVDTRIARLAAELADQSEFETPTDRAGTLDEQMVSDTVASEIKLLEERLSRQSAHQQHRGNLIDLLDTEIQILEQQAELQREEGEVHGEELENARQLVERGLMQTSRLQELMRERSQLGRDLLENQAFAARARQAKETNRYEASDSEAQKRITIQNELQEARRQKVQIEAAMQALRAQLLVVGLAQTSDSSLSEPIARMEILRMEAGQMNTITAEPGTLIQPGDVLEVKIETALPG
jgi:polysaccharide export outer membrane protein